MKRCPLKNHIYYDAQYIFSNYSLLRTSLMTMVGGARTGPYIFSNDSLLRTSLMTMVGGVRTGPYKRYVLGIDTMATPKYPTLASRKYRYFYLVLGLKKITRNENITSPKPDSYPNQ